MLMGMAMERMLKGIIVAQLGNVLKPNRSLLDSFKTHDLKKLANEITKNDPSFVFSSEEINVLDKLRPYIEWAGKYPIPINEKEYMVKIHSNTDIDLETRLWGRLREHLKSIGWIMKGSKRLYLSPKK